MTGQRAAAVTALQARHRQAEVLLGELRTAIHAQLDLEMPHWPTAALGDFATIRTIGRLRPPGLTSVGVPFIGPADLLPHGLRRSQLRAVAADCTLCAGAARLQADDLLIGRRPAQGLRCAVVPVACAGGIAADLLVIRPGPRLSGIYLDRLLHAAPWTIPLTRQALLTPIILQAWRIPLPPPLTLRAFTGQQTVINRLHAHHHAAWLALAKLRG